MEKVDFVGDLLKIMSSYALMSNVNNFTLWGYFFGGVT
jgi:hypothetical protein